MEQTMPTAIRRPHFLQPPVIEVVCGVQFPLISEWLTAHYGLYWATLKQAYPTTEDHPPLSRLRPASQRVPDDPKLSVVPPLRRVFFITEPPNYLIQLQPNRFLHNWRKLTDSDEYPRFDAAYAGFLREWRNFVNFITDHGWPAPAPEMFELTYINHITAEHASFPRDVWKYLSFYNQNPMAEPPFEPSGMSIDFVWPLQQAAGTLQMNVKHGKRLENSAEVLVVELTARGTARSDLPMEAWFEIGHDAIINSFAKLTTEDAQRTWERQA